MDLKNKTKRPLSVPLPGGKRLHLGPGKTGQITPKAAQHPPLVKLVEAGELELVDLGRGGVDRSGSTRSSTGPATGHTPPGGVRHTGDR